MVVSIVIWDKTFTTMSISIFFFSSAFNDVIHIRGERGIVSSPQTMSACGTDRECTWLIGVKRTSQIKIQFSKIALPKCSTPCACSYIEIRDGSNNTGRLIAKFCDTPSKPENICSTSNHLWIKYKYGLDLGHYGFSARYQRWQCKSKVVTESAIQSTTGESLGKWWWWWCCCIANNNDDDDVDEDIDDDDNNDERPCCYKGQQLKTNNLQNIKGLTTSVIRGWTS